MQKALLIGLVGGVLAGVLTINTGFAGIIGIVAFLVIASAARKSM